MGLQGCGNYKYVMAGVRGSGSTGLRHEPH